MRRIICVMLITALLAAVPAAAPAEDTAGIRTEVTVIRAPEQTAPQRPPCFPDPADQFIPLPETENYALNRPVSAGAHADVYVAGNVNDGKTDTYWESRGVPAEMVIDLQETRTVSAVAICLNPSSIWEPRIQEIAVQVSTDGQDYAEASAAEKYEFNAETGNRIRIDLEPVQAAFVKVIFTLNSSSRSQGAQAAEICVY